MRGLSLVAASGATLHRGAWPLTITVSLVVEHRLQTRRLSSCGSQTQLLRGMWDLPRPGLEPVSPALAGGFSTTAPTGKPLIILYIKLSLLKLLCSFALTTGQDDTFPTLLMGPTSFQSPSTLSPQLQAWACDSSLFNLWLNN